MLAAALGRSAVQVNKVISKFQADGLIRVGYDWLQVINPEALRSLSGMTGISHGPSGDNENTSGNFSEFPLREVVTR